MGLEQAREIAMKIRLDIPVRVGDIQIPSGEYQVEVHEASKLVRLSSTTAVFKLAAKERSSKMRVKNPSTQLRQVVGEPRRLLIVRTPPATEWVTSLDGAIDNAEGL
jgi:hypothetical protein